MDEDGFIWLIDRKKDVIITGGESIFPVEIENFMMNHEKVHDVGVIGLPRYKRPRKIIFGDVPRNPTGKIEKPELRKRYAGTSDIFNLS